MIPSSNIFSICLISFLCFSDRWYEQTFTSALSVRVLISCDTVNVQINVIFQVKCIAKFFADSFNALFSSSFKCFVRSNFFALYALAEVLFLCVTCIICFSHLLIHLVHIIFIKTFLQFPCNTKVTLDREIIQNEYFNFFSNFEC